MQFKFTCAPGTKWSERLNTCDHAYNVNCQVARSTESERDYEPRSGHYDPSHGGHSSGSWNAAPSYEQSTTEYNWRNEFSTTRPSVRRPFYLPPATRSPLAPSEERSRDLSHEEETTDTDSSASFWNQFSTTSPVIELATGQVSTEIITPDATPARKATTATTTTTTSTTTEAPTTRRNLFVLRRRTEPVSSTTETSTLNADEVTSARSNETKVQDEKEDAMRSENWLVNGIPKVNETIDEKVTSAHATSTVTTAVTPTEEKDEEKTDKSINRRVRMQSGSNSLIGTMMKWASKNIAKSSSSSPSRGISNETNVHSERQGGGGGEGKILMQSPFDLMEAAVELSTAKPLDPPITEANNELTAGEGEQDDQRSSMRPVYFPPSVRVPSIGTASRYVAAPNLPPLTKIVHRQANDETVHHPSPWSFPMGQSHSTQTVTSNAPNTRERRDKYLSHSKKANTPLTSHVTETHRDTHVGVISEGRCICSSKP